MHLATAVTVLTAAYLRTGRGKYVVGKGDGEGTPVWMLHDRMRAISLDLAAQFDKRNGTTACGDRVRARLDRELLVDFLPLRPAQVSAAPLPASQRPDPPATRTLKRTQRAQERGSWLDNFIPVTTMFQSVPYYARS